MKTVGEITDRILICEICIQTITWFEHLDMGQQETRRQETTGQETRVPQP
jgi:hypothetical protein